METTHAKTIDDFSLTRQRVLLRAGLDVPTDEKGNVGDTYRIERIIPTIHELRGAGAKVIIASKWGSDENLSLQPLVPILEEMLGCEVTFVQNCVGPKAERAVADMKQGDIALLENVRFHEEEKRNDPEFAKQLARLADVFINDAFAEAHRPYASIVGVPQHIPGGIGRLFEKEIQVLSRVNTAPWRPLTAIIGGVKIESKTGVISHFLDHADDLLLGGEIANVMLRAQGVSVSKPLLDRQPDLEGVPLTNTKLHLPVDVIASPTKEGDVYARETGPGAARRDELVLDIGPETVKVYGDIIDNARMIVWSGPLGYFENEHFADGTRKIADKVARNHKAFKVAGGGDTIAALKQFHAREQFDFVSTGGGAMLAFLTGKKLPALKALEEAADRA